MSTERRATEDGKVVHLDQRSTDAATTRVNFDNGELGVTLCRELMAARAAGQRAQLLVFRISNYGMLVDTFGAEFGTAAEAALMEQLRGILRRREPVQRIRPGEFGIVGRGIRSERALNAMATRMVRGGTGHYEIEGIPCRLKLEIGAAACPSDSEDPEQLLAYARFALRDAANHAGECRTFSPERLAERKAVLRMEAEMERALEERRFVLQYQPQFKVESGQIAGMEALVRMQSEDGSRVPPSEFIPVAEDNGFILRLGYWIIGEACEQLARWRRAGLAVPRISLNLSPRQLADTELLFVVDAAVRMSGIEYTDLELEITERCMVEDSTRVEETLTALRSRGVRLAVDDFGTGYSSFAYLAWKPLDMVKLDRSFLSRIDTDARTRAVVTGMIVMARELGLDIIAEGVETMEQAEFLREMGCEMAQGFALARPQDPEDIARMLISDCA